MSARQCPNCMAFVPAGQIVAYSYDLVCPNCQHPLEIAAVSQYLSAFAGLVAGAIVWWLANVHYSKESGALSWVLPMLYGYLAFSIVAPLTLIFTADLKLKPLDAVDLQYGTSTAPSPHHH
ncbi:MAG: hypothetical protein WCD49_15345 [Candidatus Acidiferrales bacterium]